MIAVVKKVIYWLEKALRDIWSTLYDADGYMSQPRFFCFALFSAILLAWILEQVFRMPFEHFAELIGAFGVAMGGYVGKKISEKKGGKTSKPKVPKKEVEEG